MLSAVALDSGGLEDTGVAPKRLPNGLLWEDAFGWLEAVDLGAKGLPSTAGCLFTLYAT